MKKKTADEPLGLEERRKIWESYFQVVYARIEEVNQAYFAGKGMLVLDGNLANPGDDQVLNVPNLCLVVQEGGSPCSLAICLTPDGKWLRVRAAIREMLISWRDTSFARLDTTLRSLLAWMMEERKTGGD